MDLINIHEAKTHLSRILERVAAGETVIIGKAGKPVATLAPYLAPEELEERLPGQLRGRIHMAEDFDTVDDDIADLFLAAEDGPVAPAD